MLFRSYCRFYTFLSQIFDYGNTALEKRWLFYKRLLPLLEFEREISTVDLSKVVLTHHHLRQLGSNSLDLQPGKAVAIPGLAPGGGGVQDKDKVQLEEIIAKLNEIFGAGLPEEQLNDACQVIPTRIKQSQLLQRQAAANTKDQFAKSPDFDHEFVGAVMGALDSHQKMSTQLLNSSEARLSFKALLLHHTNLYDDLRMRAQQDGP